MKKYFVVADVHSFYSLMMNTLQDNGFDILNKDHKLIICGDAFDRGPESVQMYYFLKDMYKKKRLIYIRGNHEDLLQKLHNSIKYNNDIGYAHYSNGTVNTYEQLARADIEIDDVLKFINKVTVNYYELGNYIFCHGWIPITKDEDGNTVLNKYAYPHIWSEYARWTNGMKEWRQGNRPTNKTVVCGHYHCNWGNYYIHEKGSAEFPEKDDPKFLKAFDPFIDDGIVALDACTAYSGKVNVLVIVADDTITDHSI